MKPCMIAVLLLCSLAALIVVGTLAVQFFLLVRDRYKLWLLSPIKGHIHYRLARRRFSVIFDDCHDEYEFETLGRNISAYEDMKYPIEKPSLRDWINFRKDQMGVSHD